MKSIFLWRTVVILGLSGLGTYLVITEHYGWAWIPFVIAASMRLKETK